MTEHAIRLQEIWFDGQTYVPSLDRDRLKSQLERVFALMMCGEWFSLSEIAKLTGASEASVSARIRDLRKDRFGGHCVERRRDNANPALWWYRLQPSYPPVPNQQTLL